MEIANDQVIAIFVKLVDIQAINQTMECGAHFLGKHPMAKGLGSANIDEPGRDFRNIASRLCGAVISEFLVHEASAVTVSGRHDTEDS
jgi:hypothetical protein